MTHAAELETTTEQVSAFQTDRRQKFDMVRVYIVNVAFLAWYISVRQIVVLRMRQRKQREGNESCDDK